MKSSPPKPSPLNFYPLEAEAQLHEGYRRVFSIQGYDLLLLQHQGQVHLLDNICPHAGYPLHQGQIIDQALRCPMHGYLFKLDSGHCILHSEGPCADLRVFPVAIREGMVGALL